MRGWDGWLVWAMCSVAVEAQVGTASLRGDVRDQAGAAVPGASVTLTAAGHGGSQTVVADTQGGYRVSGLSPGSYEVRVELAGFRPLYRKGISLSTGETVRLDFNLLTTSRRN